MANVYHCAFAFLVIGLALLVLASALPSFIFSLSTCLCAAVVGECALYIFGLNGPQRSAGEAGIFVMEKVAIF